jgi:hypothetical protein
VSSFAKIDLARKKRLLSSCCLLLLLNLLDFELGEKSPATTPKQDCHLLILLSVLGLPRSFKLATYTVASDRYGKKNVRIELQIHSYRAKNTSCFTNCFLGLVCLNAVRSELLLIGCLLPIASCFKSQMIDHSTVLLVQNNGFAKCSFLALARVVELRRDVILY